MAKTVATIRVQKISGVLGSLLRTISSPITPAPAPIMPSKFLLTVSPLGIKMKSGFSALFLCDYSALSLSLSRCFLSAYYYSDFLFASIFLICSSLYFIFLSYYYLAFRYCSFRYCSFLSCSFLYCYFLSF